MMRGLLTGFLLSLMFAQAWTQAELGFQFGGGISYDYGVGLPSSDRFVPYGKGQVGMMSFDGYTGVPLGNLPLCVYLSASWGIGLNIHPMEDLQGDYLPLGYVHEQPTDGISEPYMGGPIYTDLSALADLEQRNLGATLLLHAGGGVEFGSGLFYRRRIVSVTALQYQDTYYLNSTDGINDQYVYDDTWFAGRQEHTYRRRSLSVPLILQWRFVWDFVTTGTTFTYWVGGKDPYFSFRTSVGVNF